MLTSIREQALSRARYVRSDLIASVFTHTDNQKADNLDIDVNRAADKHADENSAHHQTDDHYDYVYTAFYDRDD